MKRKVTMMMATLMPVVALAQTAPSADQNYCTNNISLNSPVNNFVNGLCDAGRSVLASLYAYTTPTQNPGQPSKGDSAIMTAFSPPAAAPAPAAPPTQGMPAPAQPLNSGKSVNPYNYS